MYLESQIVSKLKGGAQKKERANYVTRYAVCNADKFPLEFTEDSIPPERIS